MWWQNSLLKFPLIQYLMTVVLHKPVGVWNYGTFKDLFAGVSIQSEKCTIIWWKYDWKRIYEPKIRPIKKEKFYLRKCNFTDDESNTLKK